jgi:single-stranded DNA-binding protein
MPNLRLQFSGEARKVEHKTIGGKAAVEIQLCKKNYAKQGDEPSFTWVRVMVWEPKEFQTFREGGFVAGSGEFTVRSYTDKDGNKKQSAEVRCTSFDIETPRPQEAGSEPAPVAKAAARPTQPTRRAEQAGAGDSEPPFARPLDSEVWG